MLNYLKRDIKAKFLIIGTFFMVIGLFFEKYNHLASNISFYISIVFLGFYATKEAVLDTIENKRPNVDLLMILAAIGALLIDYASEAAVLLFIFAGAEVLEEYVSSKSSNAINQLMSQVPDEARLVVSDGSIKTVPTESLKVGDIVLVAKGDQLPIDGICDREILVNESSLTGESLPIKKDKGQEVFAGTINEGDAFHIEVTKEKKDTMFSSIIRMVEQAQNTPSNKEKLIEKIESKYAIVILIVVPAFIAALYYLNDYSFRDAFYRGMVLLTVASPCALVASATPAALSAISNGAKNGILFKDGRALEMLSEIDIVATDKTGTLTHGEFEVIEYECPKDILKEVVYIEQNSTHPIAKGIYNKFRNLDLTLVNVLEIEEYAGSGLKMGDVIIGKKSIFTDFDDPNNYKSLESDTASISLVSKGNKVVGYFMLSDTVRESSKLAVRSFQKEGVIVEMLTGDSERVARKISKEVGINKFFANCLPKDKMDYINEKKLNNQKVLMIGDGINDAPALANADIGCAMGSGSSIAMESSDVVIVQNDINKLFHSYKLSQKLQKIIIQNITFSIGVIAILIGLNIFGILDLPSGVVYHESSTILVILNGLRLLYYKTV